MLLAEERQLNLDQPQGPQVDEALEGPVEHPWFPTIIEATQLSGTGVRWYILWILQHPYVPMSGEIFIYEPDVFKLLLLTSPSPIPHNQQTKLHALKQNAVNNPICQLLGKVLHGQWVRKRRITVQWKFVIVMIFTFSPTIFF